MDKRLVTDRPTIRAHKRQFTWQILMPVILVVLIMFIAGGFVIADAVLGQGQIRGWADISVIWLIIPAFFFGLAFLVVLITTVYGMAKLLPAIPLFTGKAQGIFLNLAAATHKLADGVIKPLVWFHQAQAALKSIFKR
jgi:hypothetical protein